MTVVTKTDRFVPDAPTRRLRTCECGFRGISIENWERRLGPGANRPATGSPVGENVRGENLSLIRNSDPNPGSLGNPIRGRAKSKPDAETEAFAAFYAEFPRKKKRPRALRAWVKQRCEEIADAVMAGLRRQLPEMRSRPADKIPYPASWLNDREWEDPAEATKPEPRKFMSPALRAEQERQDAHVERMAELHFGVGR